MIWSHQDWKTKHGWILPPRGGRWPALLNSSHCWRKNFPGTTVHEFRHLKTLFEGYNACMEHSFSENFIRSLRKKIIFAENTLPNFTYWNDWITPKQYPDFLIFTVYIVCLLLKTEIRAQKTGCLDTCGMGPSVVVYPEGVWYGNVQLSDIKEIVESHLVNDQPFERLQLKFAPKA